MLQLKQHQTEKRKGKASAEIKEGKEEHGRQKSKLELTYKYVYNGGILVFTCIQTDNQTHSQTADMRTGGQTDRQHTHKLVERHDRQTDWQSYAYIFLRPQNGKKVSAAMLRKLVQKYIEVRRGIRASRLNGQ